MLVFSYPVQYSTAPQILRNFIIKNKELWENKKVFVIATMGFWAVMTEQKECLEKNNIRTVADVELKTDYCIDATIKWKFDHDFKMIIPENANSIFESAFKAG